MPPTNFRPSASRAEPLPTPETRSALALLALIAGLALAGAGACSSSPGPESPADAAPIACAPPIGAVQRESCADIAKEYDVLSLDGALKRASADPHAERRAAAIQAAGSLAATLKERRVALCEESNACKVAPKDHATRDKALTDAMNELVKLWDGRKLDDPSSVERFHKDVLALGSALDPSTGAASAEAAGSAKPRAGASTAAASTIRLEGGKLTRVEGPGVTFKQEADAITVTIKDDASHDVLRATSEQAKLTGGKRYLFKLSGTYAPAAAPLLSPGDEVTVRLKYRAPEASALYVALRSLEDPDSDEASTEWKIAAGEKASREATLTAPLGSTGVYVGLGLRGAGSLELDDVEVVRGGKVLASAKAESDTEPSVKTSCTPITTRPIAGKRSLRCGGGSGDRLTIGLPASHVFMAVRGASSGERAVLRTLSLDGGRSLDATLTESAELVLGLSGPGTATFQSIEISALSK